MPKPRPGTVTPSPVAITRDDWLKAIADVCQAPLPEDDSVTIREFAEMINLGRVQAHRRMSALVEAGRAIRVSKRVRMPDGSVRTLPSYRLKA